MYIRTSSATDDLRKEIPNFYGFFDNCENCSYSVDNKEPNKSIRFYKRYNKILCDECVDKKDGTWVYPKEQEED
ncbi:hypothetical protein [Clostridium sp.]